MNTRNAVVYIGLLISGCATEVLQVPAVYYKEPSSCEFIAKLKEASKISYEVALQLLKRIASKKGGNLIRIDSGPDVESFSWRHMYSGKSSVVFFAEGDVYKCNWNQPWIKWVGLSLRSPTLLVDAKQAVATELAPMISCRRTLPSRI